MNTMQSVELTEIEGFVLDTVRGRTEVPSRACDITFKLQQSRFGSHRPWETRDRRVDNALRKLKAHGLIEYHYDGGWVAVEKSPGKIETVEASK